MALLYETQVLNAIMNIPFAVAARTRLEAPVFREVDALVDVDGTEVAVEIKAPSRPSSAMINSIVALKSSLGSTPLLLITREPWHTTFEAILEEQGIAHVKWEDEADTPALKSALLEARLSK